MANFLLFDDFRPNFKFTTWRETLYLESHDICSELGTRRLFNCDISCMRQLCEKRRIKFLHFVFMTLGNFGKVYRGEYEDVNNRNQVVAIKTLLGELFTLLVNWLSESFTWWVTHT